MNRLAWRLVVLCCIALVPVGFSAWIDPARLVNSRRDERDIVAALAAGHHVTNVMNYSDRTIERMLVPTRQQPADVLALGSSRMQALTSASFPGERFYNVSLSGGRFDDYLGLVALYSTPRSPRRVLLELDPWTLTPEQDAIRWEPLLRKRAQMLRMMGVHHSLVRDELLSRIDLFKRVADPAYFRLSVFSLRTHGVGGIHYVITDQAQNDEKTKSPDGSVVWTRISAARADSNAREYVRLMRVRQAPLDDDVFPDADQVLLLRRLIVWMVRNGVSVEIVLPPFHPLVYQELAQRPSDYVTRMEALYRAIAAQAGASVIGSYDPAVTGMTGADFFDQSHMRAESLARLIGRGQ